MLWNVHTCEGNLVRSYLIDGQLQHNNDYSELGILATDHLAEYADRVARPRAVGGQNWITWLSAIDQQAMHRTISGDSRFNAGSQVPVHGIDFVPEIWIIARIAGF